MPDKIAILQSNYIPWKGYFDLIRAVDLFVFYDEVQYTKNDWRNRNKIKTQQGAQWLTIPAGTDLSRKIHEVEINDVHWKKKHRKAIEQNYRKAPFFADYCYLLDALYDNEIANLSSYNQSTIELLARALDITTEFVDSRALNCSGSKTERLVDLVNKAGGSKYLSGPSAQDYIEPELFERAGITLQYVDYSGYDEYPQLYGTFDHAVTVLDLLFNVGPDATRYLKDL